VFVCTLVGAGGERAYARIVTAGAVLLILLLVLFTLGAGMDGAAAAVAAAEALVLGWMVREAGKRVQLPRVNEVLRPVFAAPGLAAGPLVFPASPVAAALAGIGLYAGTLLLIRGVSLSDIRLLRQL
jgi:O-antigen/teichoic acid export membrane protein